jgi:carboxylesterase type B
VLCGTTETIGSTVVHAFLGVPFAESTGGENRWEAPVPKARATERIQATQFGDICPQIPDNPLPLPPQSEDCLSINVWVPAGTPANAKLPVMVFVYGGSFLNGASAIPVYDGAYLSATQNVVLVTLNYRVGALGFLAGIEGLAGNFGLQDQQLAMQWVQDNIAKFGGDKSNVLLFGESAGAMSVGLHLLSIPSSEGLFASALMESNPLSLPYKSVAQASKPGQCLQEMLECTDLACMRSKPFEQIVSIQSDPQILLQGLLNGFAGFLVWAPAVDGTLVTQQPFGDIASGLPKPTLIGTNLDEGTLFVYSALKALGLTTLTGDEYQALLGLLFSPADTAEILAVYPPVSGDNAPLLSQVATDYIFFCSSRHLAAAGVSPVFAYEFTQVSNFNIWPDVPQCADQVCHGAEVPYVFHTASNIGATFTPAEEALSQAMASYWSGFSRPGSNPNNGGTSRPNWPAFPGFNYLNLGTPISSEVDPPHNCSLWDEIGYEVVSPAVQITVQATCVPPKTPTPTPP